MKTKIKTDATGCCSNMFALVVNNAEWIVDAKTWKSASSRSRVVRSHLLNGLDATQAWQAIGQIEEAIGRVEAGIEL